MLSIIYYIIVAAAWTVLYVLSLIALIVCYPFDKKRTVVHTISKWLTYTVFMFAPTMSRKVIGMENIDPNKAYVMVLNHQSMVDILSIYNLPLVFKWVSKREVYRIPIVGRLLWMHGDIVINRASAKEAMQLVHSKGTEWLKKGATVSIFPEGTRSKDGEIHNFKAGAFILAKDAGVPILPVVLDGTSTLARKNMMLNWRNKITIKVLPAIPAEEVAERSIKEVMAQVHGDMTQALAEIRAEKK